MSFLEKAWYKKSLWLVLLLPLSALFQFLSARRRRQLEQHSIGQADVPVIVVGNISAGGTGKTPVVMSLVSELKLKGLKPGVVSRGYGGKSESYPLSVEDQTDVRMSGDEAKLIAEHCLCPVVVDPDRVQAINYLVENFDVDIIVSDDGLQHYAMKRVVEIAIVDAERLFGNGYLMPAGPLREPISRLSEVDYVLLNGSSKQYEELDHLPVPVIDSLKRAETLRLEPTVFVNQVTGAKKPYNGAPFNMGSRLHAVAGIGNPDRFFSMLKSLPYPVECHPFADHYSFAESDFEPFAKDAKQPVVMTEKDAIKCRGFAASNFWTLLVALKLPETLVDDLLGKIKQ